MSLLDSLFGSPKVDSEEQLKQAQQQDYSKYDAEAKRNGFNNGEEYVLWLRQRQNNKTGGTVKGNSTPSADALMAWHPAYLLQHVSDLLRGANER